MLGLQGNSFLKSWVTLTEGKVAACLEQWACSEAVGSCLGLKIS